MIPFPKKKYKIIYADPPWGFQYKTIGFDWFKTNKNDNRLRFGLGTYTRGNSEPCLLATKGKVKKLIKSNNISSAITTSIRSHSRKPDLIREKIVKLCGDLPRIELFARTKIHGWDVWGNDPKLDNKPLEAFN